MRRQVRKLDKLRDANEREIIHELERTGHWVFPQDVPADLLVWCTRERLWQVVEIKNPETSHPKLTEEQTYLEWAMEQNSPYPVGPIPVAWDAQQLYDVLVCSCEHDTPPIDHRGTPLWARQNDVPPEVRKPRYLPKPK